MGSSSTMSGDLTMRGNTIIYKGPAVQLLPPITRKVVPLYLTNVFGEHTSVMLSKPAEGTVTFSKSGDTLEGKVVVFPNNHITLPDMDGAAFHLCGIDETIECVVYLPHSDMVTLTKLDETTTDRGWSSYFPLLLALKVAQATSTIPIVFTGKPSYTTDGIPEDVIVGRATLIVEDKALKALINYKPEHAHLIGRQVTMGGSSTLGTIDNKRTWVWDDLNFLSLS